LAQNPAEPHVEIAKRIRADLGQQDRDNPALVRLQATAATRDSVYDPIDLARWLANERGVDVLLDVEDGDRTHRYRAMPGGKLVSVRPDSGYAAARSTLPPSLAYQANRYGIDLRQTFLDTVDTHESFVDAVAEAVQQAALTQPAPEPIRNKLSLGADNTTPDTDSTKTKSGRPASGGPTTESSGQKRPPRLRSEQRGWLGRPRRKGYRITEPPLEKKTFIYA